MFLAIGVVAMLAVTTGFMAWAGVRPRWVPWFAVARGAAQLAVVSIALRGVLTNPFLVAAALGVMFGAATWTSWRRLLGLQWSGRAVLLSCALGASIVLTVAFALRMLTFDTRYVVALGGIVIGSTMTASTLAGRNFRTAVIARRLEVEAWLSIGATPAESVAEIGRTAVSDALTPVTDQTRTTGLVTLPGAFVGALMGGASALDAGKFQLVVLASLIAAQTISAAVLVNILGRSSCLPET